MNAASLITSRSRLFLTFAVVLTLAGAFAWQTMPRQEDPTMPYRAALLIVPFPGADAEDVERLVVDPLEEELAQVTELREVRSTSRAGAAILVLEIEDRISEVGPVWDEVEDRIADARGSFPDAVLEPEFDRDIFDQESIVVAITGDDDPLALLDAAETLKRRLLREPTVSRVVLTAEPTEQITVALDDATARRLQLDPRALAAQLAARNVALPGGSVVADGRTLTLSPNAEYGSIDEIAATPVMLPSGSIVALGEIADVRREAATPIESRMRFDGQLAVAVGVVPADAINLLTFGDDVQAVVDTLNDDIAPLRAEFMAFQPARVEERLQSLSRSLLQGVLIVALVVVLVMGPRLGIAVASIVPLVTLSALAVYAIGGGVLHQMSIAALVLALGLLVDNAIVVAEAVQSHIDAGLNRWDAARAAIRELALPLGAATGTTIAAFVPMYLSVGPTGDFTRAIPIMIMLTLTVSYLFAITVTPSLSAMLLRPTTGQNETRLHATRALSNIATRRPWVALVGAALLIAGSVQLAGQVRMQFFPASDRNQVIFDVELPEGTHLDETDATVAALEAVLAEQPGVEQVASFMGRGVPHFYYNLVQKPQRPHFAQLVVTTTSIDDVEPLLRRVRELAPATVPEALVIGRRIEQGPPVEAPIEIHVVGDDLVDLQQAADAIAATLRDTPGAVDVRHNLGQGAPSLDVTVNDAAAARAGVTREDVALALLGQTRGLTLGQYRAGDDPVPIVSRADEGDRTTTDQLETLLVSRPGVPAVPLEQVAHLTPTWRPAVLSHRNFRRYVTVSAQLDAGVTYADVLDRSQPTLEGLDLPASVTLSLGGDAEGSGEANAALLTTLPIGLLLLLTFLMGEFNSFRKVGIVLLTVPLAATGVIPGLVFGGQPFGFMSMLGVFALIGIVVNNAIVLLDVIGARRSEGATVAEAIDAAIAARTRPILLTTATTVAGLLPLAVSPSTFWPPLASSMISGLLASTVLTLLVVPSMYRLLFRDRDVRPDAATA